MTRCKFTHFLFHFLSLLHDNYWKKSGKWLKSRSDHCDFKSPLFVSSNFSFIQFGKQFIASYGTRLRGSVFLIKFRVLAREFESRTFSAPRRKLGFIYNSNAIQHCMIFFRETSTFISRLSSFNAFFSDTMNFAIEVQGNWKGTKNLQSNSEMLCGLSLIYWRCCLVVKAKRKEIGYSFWFL